MSLPLLPTTRAAKIRLAVLSVVLLSLLVTLGGSLMWMIGMPGSSFEGELPPPTDEEREMIERLRGDVRVLAWQIGERNTRESGALDRAAHYLENRLADMQYDVDELRFEASGQTVRNIQAVLQGGARADESVVVGAHYDTVRNTPGADDNASGAAALLEVAHRLRDASLDRTVRFVLFVNEEPPFFQTDEMGSLVYARSLAEAGESVHAMISLESIGYYDDAPDSQHYPFPFGMFYPSEGNFVAFVGDVSSRWLVREAIGAFREAVPFPSEGVASPGSIPGIGWSDHWAFWQQDWPAIMITDTAPFRNPNYHEPTDTVETIDFEALARVTLGVEAVVRSLARP